MKSYLLLLLLFVLNFVHGQNNGYIIKNNDTIQANFNIDELTVRSFGKIERLQEKVKYTLNGENYTSKPNEINGFCIKSNGNNFCFDSFYSENDKKGSFMYRVIGKKVDRLTIYQFYGSGFYGVNYSVKIGYLIKKQNQKDIVFQPFTGKQWKDELVKIIEDCPLYQKYIVDNVKKITFEDDFQNYLLEYLKKCNK